MKTFAASLVLCAACAAAPGGTPAQKGAAADGFRVRARGKSLVLTERGRARVLRVADKIDAARIEEASVVFVSRAGEFVYLVLDNAATGWEVSGGGDCRPMLVLPDWGPATWRLDPEEGRPGPDATSSAEASCLSVRANITDPMIATSSNTLAISKGSEA